MRNKLYKKSILLFGFILLFLGVEQCASLKKIKERDDVLVQKNELISVMSNFGIWDKKHQQNLLCNDDSITKISEYREKRDSLLKKGTSLLSSEKIKSHKEELIKFMKQEDTKEKLCPQPL